MDKRYDAFPLATTGLVAIDPIRNPVTWWVEDGETSRIIGPFQDVATADKRAAELNAAPRRI